MKELSDRVAYLPASISPLSAEVGFVHGDTCEWIFDVGSSGEAAAEIGKIDRKKRVILSHFHRDHTANLSHIFCDSIYCGEYTQKKLGKGVAVKAPLVLTDGISLTVFPLPGLHAKGAVGLLVNEEFAFLWDAVYGAPKDGKTAYNLTLLKETILVLEALKADQFLISHDAAFVREKAEVLSRLKNLYQTRRPGEAYLFL